MACLLTSGPTSCPYHTIQCYQILFIESRHAYYYLLPAHGLAILPQKHKAIEGESIAARLGGSTSIPPKPKADGDGRLRAACTSTHTLSILHAAFLPFIPSPKNVTLMFLEWPRKTNSTQANQTKQEKRHTSALKTQSPAPFRTHSPRHKPHTISAPNLLWQPTTSIWTTSESGTTWNHDIEGSSWMLERLHQCLM
jgi:hypothetical protein